MKRSVAIGALLIGCGVLAAVFFVRGHSNSPPPVELSTFYIPQETKCVVFVDCQGVRAELERLSSPARVTRLTQLLLAEYRRDGGKKIAGATTVELTAVYLPRKDNYGRPDFSSRVSLLQLTGSPEQLAALTDGDAKNLDELRRKVTVDVSF